ncbi:MAG: hypothetical protein ABI183_10585 [Polyangiaceae bacterium]
MKKTRAHAWWVVAVTALSIALLGASACEGDDTEVSSGFDDAATADTSTPSDASDANVGDAVTPFDANSDAPCASGACVVGLAANGHDSCAIMSDSTVRCWGSNNNGELGFGSPDANTVAFVNVATPTTVPGLHDVKSVAVGGFYDPATNGFTCALIADGGVLCWGVDNEGQLGRGDAGPDFVDPTPAPVLLPGPVMQVSASADTACAVEQTGDILCWGGNGFKEVSPVLGPQVSVPTTIIAPTTFTQVSVGVDICAISIDKHVWCWGRPTFGSSGRLATDGGLQDVVPAELDGLDNVVQIAAAEPGSCALTSDGVVHCWGGTAFGNGTSLLGRGDVDSGQFDPNPAPVVMPSGVIFKQLVAHSYGFCALDQFGSVWCWGNNYYGSDAITYADGGGVYPVWVPTQVSSLSNIVELASGGAAMHVCALDRNGAVKCWGYNMYEQLGTPLFDGGPVTSLIPLDVVFP